MSEGQGFRLKVEGNTLRKDLNMLRNKKAERSGADLEI